MTVVEFKPSCGMRVQPIVTPYRVCFPHSQIYKSFMKLITGQPAKSVHEVSTELNQASPSEILAFQVEVDEEVWNKPSQNRRWTTVAQSGYQSWWYEQTDLSRHLQNKNTSHEQKKPGKKKSPPEHKWPQTLNPKCMKVCIYLWIQAS